MTIYFQKDVFSEIETNHIVRQLHVMKRLGAIAERSENNENLLVAFCGKSPKCVSPKWNVKIYTFNERKGGHSIVCTDKRLLQILVEEKISQLVRSGK